MEDIDSRLGNEECQVERNCGTLAVGCLAFFLFATALAGGSYYIQKALSGNEPKEKKPYIGFLEASQENKGTGKVKSNVQDVAPYGRSLYQPSEESSEKRLERLETLGTLGR